VLSFFAAGYLGHFPYLTCPVDEYSTAISCTRDAVFVPITYRIPPAMSALLRHLLHRSIWSVDIMPLQFHAIVMAFFASIVSNLFLFNIDST
jgi:hypothetical protein